MPSPALSLRSSQRSPLRNISVYGTANLVGHLLKFASYRFIYIALIRRGLPLPYVIFFKELCNSKDALRKEEERLEQSLVAVKELRELLPICSHCRKIRDGRGYWNRSQAYIERHACRFQPRHLRRVYLPIVPGRRNDIYRNLI